MSELPCKITPSRAVGRAWSATGVCAALAMLLIAGNTSPAQADIVWEGRTVPAWPEGAFDAQPQAPVAGAPLAAKFYTPRSGSVWGLTIIVDFSDQAPAFSKPQIEAWLNQRNYSVAGLNGSVRDYFSDVSNGKLDFQNDVVGFYRAKNTKSYYEGGNGYARADELFREVIAALDPTVDFSKYDNDGDGNTDAVSLVYAGPQKTWGQGLWPHASGSSLRADGVLLKRYMMSALESKLALYTFCHEVGHMLFGWPDLYGFGDYCLMGNATNPANPSGINDFFRADQGWLPEVEVTSDMNRRLRAGVNSGGYRYSNPKDSGECFFWSNIQNQARWKGLRGSGLLLLHYQRSIGTNTPPNPLALQVVEADGRNDLNQTMWPAPGSSASDFFYAGGVHEISDSTTPNAHWRDGSSSGLRLHDVAGSGTEMEFSVGKLPPIVEVPPDASTPADAGTSDDAGVVSGVSDAGDQGTALDAALGGGQPVATSDAAVAGGSDAAALPTESGERGDDGCSLRAGPREDRSRSLLKWAALLGLAVLARRKSRRGSSGQHASAG